MSSYGRVIDAHAHITPPSIGADRRDRSWFGAIELSYGESGSLTIATPRWTRVVQPELVGSDVGERVRDMDEDGVDVQFLSLMPSLWFHGMEGFDEVSACRELNDELLDATAPWADRFRLFATLPLGTPSAAVAELGRVMRAGRVIGVGVNTSVDDKNWDHPDLFPVLEAAEDLRALVFFHPPPLTRLKPFASYFLHNTVGNPAETTLTIGTLIFGGVLDRLPGLRAVFAHGGGYIATAASRFDHSHRVRAEAKAPQLRPSEYLSRFYFDCLTHGDGPLRALADAVGYDRIVLGTDYPADMGRRGSVRWIEGLPFLTDSEKTAVLGDNIGKELGRR